MDENLSKISTIESFDAQKITKNQSKISTCKASEKDRRLALAIDENLIKYGRKKYPLWKKMGRKNRRS